MFKTCPFVTLLGLFGHPWNFGPGKSETVSNDHFPISNWLGVTLSHDFTLLPQGKTCPPPIHPLRSTSSSHTLFRTCYPLAPYPPQNLLCQPAHPYLHKSLCLGQSTHALLPGCLFSGFKKHLKTHHFKVVFASNEPQQLL